MTGSKSPDPGPNSAPTRQPHEERGPDSRQPGTETEANREKETERSLINRPVDPNSLPAKAPNVPPGVPAEDVKDPGNQTPGAPPVDNRS